MLNNYKKIFRYIRYKYLNTIVLIKIIIIILYPNQIYGDLSKVAYRCKMANGAIGYYDRSCKYIASDNTGIFRGQKLIEETIFTLNTKLIIKNLANNNIFSVATENKKLEISSKLSKSKLSKGLTQDQLAKKRCQNAINKISLIEQLLQNQYINNLHNNDLILSKAKRSLYRYKVIKKKYCKNTEM